MAVDTPGGRKHVLWVHEASTSPNAQLTFFAEFLAATGVYEACVNCCPLNCTISNVPKKKTYWHLAAGHTCRAQPVHPYHRIAIGCGEPTGTEDEQNHQRRRAAPRTHAP